MAIIPTFDSIAGFRAWLTKQPDNTPETPYTVKLNVSDNVIEPFDFIFIDEINCGRFFCLDLSGSTITTIPADAFCGAPLHECARLAGITMPDGVTSIGEYAFAGCYFTSITIPDSVTSIGEDAFCECENLESVTIPDSVTSIGKDAFFGCESLIEINVADGNTAYTTENGVLYNKDKTILIHYPAKKTASSFTIPDGVTGIGEHAFFICESLTVITIPDSVTSIGESAFSGCDSLAEINVAADNSAYTTENGVLYNKDKTILLKYPAGKTDAFFTIPNGVTSIGEWAFSNCGLTSVTIPNGVTNIGYGAFSDCIRLKSVTIGNSVTSIEKLVFSGCAKLTSITIPDSVTSIGEWAFSGCTSLENVTIGNSVKIIEEMAFAYCTLISVTIPDSVTSIGAMVFIYCKRLTSVTFKGMIPSSMLKDNTFEGDLRAVFYATDPSNGTPGTYTSSDGGNTWIKL